MGGMHRVRVQPRSRRSRRWILHHKGGCHRPAPAATAAGVPRHFLIGALDEPYRRDNITAVFEAGRAAGALWALSTDPLQHGPIVDFDLMFDSIDGVLAARFRKLEVRRSVQLPSRTAGSATDRAARSRRMRASAPIARARGGCPLPRPRSIGNGWRKAPQS